MSIKRFTHNGYAMEPTTYGAYVRYSDYERDTARLAKLERLYAAIVRNHSISDAVWSDPEDVENLRASEDEAHAALDDLKEPKK